MATRQSRCHHRIIDSTMLLRHLILSRLVRRRSRCCYLLGASSSPLPPALSPHRPDQHLDRLHFLLACSCTGPSLVERRRHIPSAVLILQCPFCKHTKPLGLSPPNTATHRLFCPDSRLNHSRCCGALSNEIPNTGIRHSIRLDQLVRILALITHRCRCVTSSTLSSDWPMPSEHKARKARGLRIRGSPVTCRRQCLQLVSVTGPHEALCSWNVATQLNYLGPLLVDSIIFWRLPRLPGVWTNSTQ